MKILCVLPVMWLVRKSPYVVIDVILLVEFIEYEEKFDTTIKNTFLPIEYWLHFNTHILDQEVMPINKSIVTFATLTIIKEVRTCLIVPAGLTELHDTMIHIDWWCHIVIWIPSDAV